MIPPWYVRKELMNFADFLMGFSVSDTVYGRCYLAADCFVLRFHMASHLLHDFSGCYKPLFRV